MPKTFPSEEEEEEYKYSMKKRQFIYTVKFSIYKQLLSPFVLTLQRRVQVTEYVLAAVESVPPAVSTSTGSQYCDQKS